MQVVVHPNAVPLVQCFVERDDYILVMPYYRRGDLQREIERRLAEGTRFAEGEIWGILRDVISPMAYANYRGIMHRDLKAENILVGDETDGVTRYYVADFGLAKELERSLQSAQSAGTVLYQSPEIKAGTYTVKSDVWSVGVVTYQLMALGLPFVPAGARSGYHQRAWDLAVFSLVRANKPKPIDPAYGYSKELIKFSKQLLATDYQQRPSFMDIVRGENKVARMLSDEERLRYVEKQRRCPCPCYGSKYHANYNVY